MSVYKRPGQSTYTYDFQYRGRRFSGRTECTTEREARKVEASKRREAQAARIDASKPLTFNAAASRYWHEVGQFHRNSTDTWRSIGWLERGMGRDKLISTITDSHVAALVAKRRGDGVSAATVNRSVCEPLRGILRRASKIWKAEVHEIEWKKHFLKEPQERIREASGDEEAKLLSAIRPDYLPALRFALMTGCRRAEIVGLKWSSVDFFNRQLSILGKGDRRRTIPMTDALYSLLWELRLNHEEAVFTYAAKRARDGRGRGQRYPITMEGFKTEWRRVMNKVGIDDYRFHDNRHTAATRLVRKTGNLRLAQKLLGHTDIKTTTRYAHVTNEDLRAGMEASAPTDIVTKGDEHALNALKKKGKVV